MSDRHCNDSHQPDFHTGTGTVWPTADMHTPVALQAAGSTALQGHLLYSSPAHGCRDMQGEQGVHDGEKLANIVQYMAGQIYSTLCTNMHMCHCEEKQHASMYQQPASARPKNSYDRPGQIISGHQVQHSPKEDTAVHARM